MTPGTWRRASVAPESRTSGIGRSLRAILDSNRARRAGMGLLLMAAGACSDGTTEPEPQPEPLETVFIGDVEGATRQEVEAACKAVALPDADWRYVIEVRGRTVTRHHENPWPGRGAGDVHAAELETVGPYRFTCTATHRNGQTDPTGHPPFDVEFGETADPVLVEKDRQVCQGDGAGGSQPTAANTGSVACPYEFGALFPASSDFAAAGPYATTQAVEGPACTIFRPETLGENGERHPVLLWANGITLWPFFYEGLLTHLASHGFVVAAADTSRVGQAGTGENLLGCLAYLEVQYEVAGSVYQDALNLYRVGAAGHSAGGGGVLMAGRDPRITATAPIQPWVGAVHGFQSASAAMQNGPMFLSSGSEDTEIPAFHHPMVFDSANVPTIWATLQGSGHNDPLFSAGAYRGPTTAWFRYHLMLDASARDLFYGAECGLCTAPGWIVQKKNGI